MQIFTFWTVNNGNLHVPANFRLDRLNGVVDIAIFFYFEYGGSPPFWIFEICKFSLSARFTMVMCMFLQNFVMIGWTVAELLQIKYFQYGGRPPSWIRFPHTRDHSRCRIAGPKKPWKFCPKRLNSFSDIAISPFWGFCWGVLIHAPILGGFSGVRPTKSGQLSSRPQKAPMVTTARRMSYHVSKSV